MRGPRSTVAAAIVVGAVALAAGAPPVAAQTPTARAAADARRAQQRFESFHRFHLPTDLGGAGPCEEQVGRFCYWHTDQDDPMPKEPAAVARERDRVVAALDRAAAAAPGDDWTAGQLVRYLVEGGRSAEAVAAARRCAGTAWWCAALRGFAAHEAEDDSTADDAFDRALAAMPPDERCRWTDVSPWLEGSAAERFRKLRCDDAGLVRRDAMAARLWWLARPMLTRAPGDARSELLSRRVAARLYREAPTVRQTAWGDDVEELLLRYGRETAWARREQSYAPIGASPDVIGRERTPGLAVAPSAHAMDDPLAARADDWLPRAARPHSRYATLYASRLTSLRHQIVSFRRGDSAVVVAAYEAGRDSMEGPLRAGVALGTGPAHMTTVVRDSAARRGALVARVRAESLLVSLEVESRASRSIERARYAVAPPSDTGVSELLLVAPAALDGDVTLERVADGALPSPRVEAGHAVGLYWELYRPVPADSTVGVSLRVTPVGMSVSQRIAEALRLAEHRSPTEIRWQRGAAAAEQGLGTWLVLRTGEMPPGRYRLDLELRPPGSAPVTTSREIEIVAP